MVRTNQIDARMISNTIIDAQLYAQSVIPTDIDSTASYIKVKCDSSSTIDASVGQDYTRLVLKLQIENETGNYLLLEELENVYRLKMLSKSNRLLSTVDIPKNKCLPDYSKIKNKYLYVNNQGLLTWSELPAPIQNASKILYDTVENWNKKALYKAELNTIYIYTDKYSYTDEYGKTQLVPGIKIGTGKAYLIDLPFITDYTTRKLLEHTQNTEVHIQPDEREKWNNKLNYIDPKGSDILIFTRN